MNLTNIFNEKTVFSLEVFPPHSAKETNNLIDSFKGVNSIKPDFISITSGAGGSQNDISLDLAKQFQNDLGITTIPHITGLYRSKADVITFLNELGSNGIQNVLALRGDQIPDKKPVGDFKRASELVKFIKKHGKFNIAGACYPQKHPESINFVDDILHLKEKVNQGVSYLITQTLFDNQAFYDFRERLQFAQVDVPIEVGIMPCTNLNQIKKITELSGNPMPKKFVDIMDHFRNNQEAMRDAGINYAIEQIVDLLSNNADGIHLYTMNNAENVQQIWDATHTLFAETSNHPTERV